MLLRKRTRKKGRAFPDVALLLPVLAACVPGLCFYRNTPKEKFNWREYSGGGREQAELLI